LAKKKTKREQMGTTLQKINSRAKINRGQRNEGGSTRQGGKKKMEKRDDTQRYGHQKKFPPAGTRETKSSKKSQT